MARFKFKFKQVWVDSDQVEDSDEEVPRLNFSFESDEVEEEATQHPSILEDNDKTLLGKRQRGVGGWKMQDSRNKSRPGQVKPEKRTWGSWLGGSRSVRCQSQRQHFFPVSRLAAIEMDSSVVGSSSLANSSPTYGVAKDAGVPSRTAGVLGKASAEVCGEHSVEKPKLIVMRGDPTDWSTGAIVSDTNSLLHHNCGLAATIVRKGGLEIQRQSTEWVYYHGEVHIGTATWTTAGKLSSKFIVHTVGPDVSNYRWPTQQHRTDLRRAVRSALNMADNLGVKSVAIPAISTGVSRYPKYLAAREIIEVCLQFCEDSPPTALSLIVLMNEDEVTTSIFAQTLKEVKQQRQLQHHWSGIDARPHELLRDVV